MPSNLFTKEEKIAISNILILLVTIDSEIADEEVMFLAQLRKVLNLDDEIIEKAKDQEYLASLQIIDKMGEAQKDALAMLMIEMAKADGEVSAEEYTLVLFVARICGLPIQG